MLIETAFDVTEIDFQALRLGDKVVAANSNGCFVTGQVGWLLRVSDDRIKAVKLRGLGVWFAGDDFEQWYLLNEGSRSEGENG